MDKDLQILLYRIKDRVVHKILMAPITEQQEFHLDNNDSITIVINNEERTIEKKKVFFYGNIDFSADSDDLAVIENMNLIPRDSMRGVCIPSKYSYKNHTAVGNYIGPYWYDTTRTDLLLKFKHGCLGKPERIIVWQENGNKHR